MWRNRVECPAHLIPPARPHSPYRNRPGLRVQVVSFGDQFIADEVLGMKYGLARSTQALEDVEDKIERVIADCKWTEENIDPSNHALWVLKFFGLTDS